jgi:1-pyrroline-5-carboxylate dehydrogenase
MTGIPLRGWPEMSDRLSVPPPPTNEPVRTYVPGSDERRSLTRRLDRMVAEAPAELACWIDGRAVHTGDTFAAVAPHDHGLHLAEVHAAGAEQTSQAIDAALAARLDWAAMDWRDRAAILLRAADLLAGPWRDAINAATMLHQSKTVHQAEIDAACELIDFLRFNTAFYRQILDTQPGQADGIWNQVDYRPLEGFVLAVTPFNFTAIAGNLPTAPALCGNTVVWKPSEKQAVAADVFMQVLREAGLPDGVINLVHGDGATISQVCLDHPEFAGLHFTGSIDVFRGLWRKIGDRIDAYRGFPRIVGETGGKDFVVVHPSADLDQVATALVRGAFEYQGQKCSAASRAYIPRSRWDALSERVADTTATIAMGDVADLRTFMGAVIDDKAFARHRGALDGVADDPALELVVGGGTDDSVGWFVEPSVVRTTDPRHDLMRRELFGPILTVFVYDDADWSATLDLVDSTSPYGLTGAVFAQDRATVVEASERLRHAAGNFYVNDKPTGSVVGQQPFGGARASGTNDKAGSAQNLLRWISTRSIKETFVAPTDYRYPSMR